MFIIIAIGMWGVPARNNLFTGREEQLTALHDKLFQENVAEKNNSNNSFNQKNCGIKRTELGGIGGVGKTQLSIEYCHRHFGSKYGFVVMVRAESQASIAQDMRRLALDLGLLSSSEKLNRNLVEKNLENDDKNQSCNDDNQVNDYDECDERNLFTKNPIAATVTIDDEEVTEIIKRKLSRCRYRWLMVFDNVEDISIISKYLPRGQLSEQFSSSKISSNFLSSGFLEKNTRGNKFEENYLDEKYENFSDQNLVKISGKNSGTNFGVNLECLGGGHVIVTSRTSYHNKNNNYNNYSINKNNIFDYDSQDVRTSSSSSIFLECFNKSESLKFLGSSLRQNNNFNKNDDNDNDNNNDTIISNSSTLFSTSIGTSHSTSTQKNNESSLKTFPSSSSSSSSFSSSIHSHSNTYTSPGSSAYIDECKSLSILADRMGHLPLALSMVSAYLTRCDVTASEYLARLDRLILYDDNDSDSDSDSDDEIDNNVDKKSNDDDDDNHDCNNDNVSNKNKKIEKNHNLNLKIKKKNKKEVDKIMGANDYSVVSSLSISLDRIAGESEAAFSVLLLLGFLSPDGITKNLIKLLLEIAYFKTKLSSNEFLDDDDDDHDDDDYNDRINCVENKKLKYSNIGHVNENHFNEIDEDKIEKSINDINENIISQKKILEEYSPLLLSDPFVDINIENLIKNRILTKEEMIKNNTESNKIKQTQRIIISVSTVAVSVFLFPFRRINTLSVKDKLNFTVLSFFALYGFGCMIDNITTFKKKEKNQNDGKDSKYDIKQLIEQINNIKNNQIKKLLENEDIRTINKNNKKRNSERNENGIENVEAINSIATINSKKNKKDKNLKFKSEKNKIFVSQESLLRETDHVWELLKQFSLLSVRGVSNNRIGSIHRLQQSVLRSRNFLIGGMDSIKIQLEKCIYAINFMWKFDIKNTDTWEDCGLILNHIQYLVEHVRKYTVQKIVARRFSVILTQAALYSTEVLSRFDFSQNLLESAVAIQNKIICFDNGRVKGAKIELIIGKDKIEEEEEEKKKKKNENDNEIDDKNDKESNIIDRIGEEEGRKMLKQKKGKKKENRPDVKLNNETAKCDIDVDVVLNSHTKYDLKQNEIFLDEKADTMHLLGKVFRIRGDYEKAEKFLLLALQMRKKTQSRKICDTFHELGVLSLRHHEYSLAHTYLTNSLKLKKELKVEMIEKRKEKNKKTSFNRGEESDNGKGNKSRKIREKEKDDKNDFKITETSEAATLHQLAVIATGEGSYDEAELLLLRALELESVWENDEGEGKGEESEENDEEEDEGVKNRDGDEKVEKEKEKEKEKEADREVQIGRKEEVEEERERQEMNKMEGWMHGEKAEEGVKEGQKEEDAQKKGGKKMMRGLKREKIVTKESSTLLREKSILRKIEKLKRKMNFDTEGRKNFDGDNNNDNRINDNDSNNRPQSRNIISRAATLQQLGRVALRQGKLIEAKTRFNDSLSLYFNAYGKEKFSNHINVAAVYHQLGSCYSAMHLFCDASKHFNLALIARENIYRNSSNNYNNNNDNNNDDECNDENNYSNIEIIQEIQALGQSEMMTGRLDSAEKHFLRQLNMCANALNLDLRKFSIENSEITSNGKKNIIDNENSDCGMDICLNISSETKQENVNLNNAININTNIHTDMGVNNNMNDKEINSFSSSSPSSLSSSSSPILFHISPQLKRKEDTLIKSLLFSVYCLKGIENKRKNSVVAGEFSKLAKTIKRVLIRKKVYQNNLNISDVTLSISNNKNNDNNDDDKNNSNNNKNKIGAEEIDKRSDPNNINSDCNVNNYQDNDSNSDNKINGKDLNNLLEKQESDYHFETILLHLRNNIRSLAVQLLKGEVSACALSTALIEIQKIEKYFCQEIEKNNEMKMNGRIIPDLKKKNLNDAEINSNRNLDLLMESGRDQKVLLVGQQFSKNCIINLKNIIDFEFPILSKCSSSVHGSENIKRKNIKSNNMTKNKSNDIVEIENNINIYDIKLSIKNIFNHCDLLRSSLRDLGLKIEDS